MKRYVIIWMNDIIFIIPNFPPLTEKGLLIEFSSLFSFSVFYIWQPWSFTLRLAGRFNQASSIVEAKSREGDLARW